MLLSAGLGQMNTFDQLLLTAWTSVLVVGFWLLMEP